MSNRQFLLEAIEDTAEEVLIGSFFVTSRQPLVAGGRSVLIAENAYYLLAVVPFGDWSQAAQSLQQMQLELTQWAGARYPGPKAWDLYLVGLLTSPIVEGERDDVSHLVSDTRWVRKVVRASVEPTYNGVRDALSAFLPIVQLDRSPIDSPMARLSAAMVARGIPSARINAAIASFEETGKVILP